MLSREDSKNHVPLILQIEGEDLFELLILIFLFPFFFFLAFL